MKLLDLFVQFSMKGVEALKAEMGKVEQVVDGVGKGIQKVGSLATGVFAGLTSTITGFAIAGFAGSAQMEAMGVQMGRLSRGIAALFVPEMNKLIGVVQRAADWFHKLDGPQQKLISNLAQGAIAGLAVASVIGVVGVAIIGLVPPIMAVVGAATLLDAFLAGIPLIVGIIVTEIMALVGGLTALTVGTETGRTALGKLFSIIKPIASAAMDLFGAIGEAVSPVVDLLSDFAQTLIENVSSPFEWVAGNIKDVAAAIKAGVGEIAPYFRMLTTVGGDLMRELSTPLKDLFSSFSTMLPTIGQMIGFLVRQIVVMLETIKHSIAITMTMFHALKDLSMLKDPAKLLADYQANLAKLTAMGKDKDKNQSANRVDVAAHGAEAITATFTRLQAAALKIDYDRVTADATVKTAANTAKTNQLLERIASGPIGIFG
jgi:hypothetical protein